MEFGDISQSKVALEEEKDEILDFEQMGDCNGLSTPIQSMRDKDFNKIDLKPQVKIATLNKLLHKIRKKRKVLRCSGSAMLLWSEVHG